MGCVRRLWIAPAVLLVAGWLLLAPGAEANPDIKKAIWGPHDIGSFAHYADLGTGIYEIELDWRWAAPTRPDHPRDPSDPAYRWAARITDAVQQSRALGMQVMLLVTFSPAWANGGRSRYWAPHPDAYADFVKAASRRYRYVKYWQIWGEPSRANGFKPMATVHSARRLTRREKRGPKLYARILNAAYGSLKSVNPGDNVIGGNTLTYGDVRPLRFIQAMRLPSGRPPRMDLYGHNPYGPRKPHLSNPPLSYGAADFSDLDTLAHWIDKYLGRRPNGKRIRIFVTEYNLCTGHANHLFNWWGNRQDQAAYARAALRITRAYKRIFSMGWFQLFDEAPRPAGDEANYGLLDYKGNIKPAYDAYKNN